MEKSSPKNKKPRYFLGSEVFISLAEREGFEPSVLENQYAGFRIRQIYHLSVLNDVDTINENQQLNQIHPVMTTWQVLIEMDVNIEIQSVNSL